MDTSQTSAESCEPPSSETRIARTIKLDDTTYDLFIGPCKCGRCNVRRLMRTNGASLSVYEITDDEFANLDEFVALLHQSFSIDVTTKLSELREAIHECNSRGLFDVAGMHPFKVRLIDKARLICNRFSKNGKLKKLLKNQDDTNNDIASAFILGSIATEIHWLRVHSDAVFEGWAHIEGREAGRPLALAARIRQGKRTRKAVMTAAEILYEQEPALRRNDSKTADRIIALKIGELRKRDGTYLGADAVIKHLRAARSATTSGKINKTFRKSENRI